MLLEFAPFCSTIFNVLMCLNFPPFIRKNIIHKRKQKTPRYGQYYWWKNNNIITYIFWLPDSHFLLHHYSQKVDIGLIVNMLKPNPWPTEDVWSGQNVKLHTMITGLWSSEVREGCVVMWDIAVEGGMTNSWIYVLQRFHTGWLKILKGVWIQNFLLFGILNKI